MATAVYGSKLSQNMVMLKDGYLLCRDVPICRTGTYQYLESEIGREGNNIVTVFRDPRDVFDQKTIASFQHVPFTNDHPPEKVSVDNWQIYHKGELNDVQRGTGDLADCLVADIVVRDPVTIQQIQAGKREVSCGYECEYVERNGKIFQTNIRGNHLSLVNNGRAGSSIAIRDNETVEKAATFKTLEKVLDSNYRFEHERDHYMVYNNNMFIGSADNIKEVNQLIDEDEKRRFTKDTFAECLKKLNSN